MQGILYALALGAGIALTIQVGVNAVARGFLGNDAVIAAFASFAVGAIALAGYLLLTRAQWPGRGSVGTIPLWVWSGGLLGAFYVITSTIVGPRLGAAAFLALVVLGQLCSSLLVDHFGWLGFPQHSITLVRLAGVLALLVGVALIAR
jgi:transporter family-2 protein